MKDKVGGIFDGITEKWKNFIKFFTDTKDGISGFFGKLGFGSGDDIAANTEKAQATIDGYSSNTLNQGGNTMSQRSQVNHVSVGGATVDARGMSQQQATSAVSAGMKQSVEMAIGQLSDGIVA